MFDDPNWPRAGRWLESGSMPCSLGILGAPVRLGSITPGRCDLTPQAVRNALLRFSVYDIEADIDVSTLAVNDFGDLAVSEMRLEDAFHPVSTALAGLLGAAAKVVVLGGDNGVTYPGVSALAECYNGDLRSVGLLTLDAHFDLRDLEEGLSNGNPVRALLQRGLPGRNIAQLGIMGFANSKAYARVASDAGVNVVTMDVLREKGIESAVNEALADLSERVEAIYFDLDVDVLDRAFAPACPGARPGGLTPWEVKLAARICGRHPQVRVMDLVEVDPSQDVAEVTVLTTAACLLSFASGMLERGNANG